MPMVFCESDSQIKSHENTASHTHSGNRMVSANKSVSQLPQGDPGGISTMWIDTARYATCRKSANRAASARLSCLVPIDSCSTVPCNHCWPRSASPFKTPPRSQVYTCSTPGSSAATQQSES
ncbi:hypothetical protein BASA83_001574 [Batrachochytrium salamandrivorans]|nr:hypothetical protein BASA83_001574 [Batrachochytrium salamandrivorans]